MRETKVMGEIPPLRVRKSLFPLILFLLKANFICLANPLLPGPSRTNGSALPLHGKQIPK